MSQFPGDFGDFERLTPHQGPGFEEPAKRSVLSVIALVTAFIVCCPALPLLAVPLGLGGVVSCLVSNGRRKGVFMGIMAIILGVVFTMAQFMFLEWGFRTMVSGPINATLEALETGDVAAARIHLTIEANGTVTDDELRAFGETMVDRYGSFQMWNINVDQQWDVDPTARIYRLQGEVVFDRGSFPTDAVFEAVDAPQSMSELYRIVSLTIVDPQGGNLTLGTPPGDLGGTGILPAPAPGPDPDKGVGDEAGDGGAESDEDGG